MVAINLSIHLKLCSLREQTAAVSSSSSAPSVAAPLSRPGETLISDEECRWRHAQTLMTKIVKGLSQMPPVEMAVASDDPKREVVGMSTAEQKKLLVTTAQTLDKEVIGPLMDLSQATTFHAQMVQERYHRQREIIDGRGAPEDVEKRVEEVIATIASDNKGETEASTEDGQLALSLDLGLKNILRVLQHQQETLAARLARMESRFDTLCGEAMRVAAQQSTLHRHRLSPEEKVYDRQLRDWSQKVSDLGRMVDKLKQQSSSSAMQPVAPSTPTTRGASVGAIGLETPSTPSR